MNLEKNGTVKICSRGHKFVHSSNCPVCPHCWPGHKKNLLAAGWPEDLGAPALRALKNAGIKNLKQLPGWSEKQLLALHGVGPSSIPKLTKALRKLGLGFKGGKKE